MSPELIYVLKNEDVMTVNLEKTNIFSLGIILI